MLDTDIHTPSHAYRPHSDQIIPIQSAVIDPSNGPSRREVLERANQINVARATPETRVGVIANLLGNVPQNELGLPTFIYRPDIIPPDLDTYTAEQRVGILQAASVNLTFEQGYPTLENGQIFWSRFPWEPLDAFEMFQKYVEMPTLHTEITTSSGAPVNKGVQDASNVQIAVRDLSSLAQLYAPAEVKFSKTPATTIAQFEKTIKEWAILYCWHSRVKAYDLYIAAAYRKWREQQTYAVEQSHFKISKRLLELANTELVERLQDPEQKLEMKPKDLLDIVKSMAQLQRISLGLSANGDRNGENGETPKNASLEVTLKSIAKTAGEEARIMQNTDQIQSILEDPDALVKAQELIIKLNQR